MKEKIKAMRIGGLIGKTAFTSVEKLISAENYLGVTTLEISKLVGRIIKNHYGESAALGQYNPKNKSDLFPADCCVSVNEEIVHGVPGERELHEGDLVSVDICLRYDGYIVDACRTFEVGPVEHDKLELNRWTKIALQRGLKKVKAGVPWNVVAGEIENTANRQSYGIVREFTGHGVGRKLWENFSLPNYVSKESNEIILQEGDTIAIEPMFTKGSPGVTFLPDNWTAITEDGGYSVHWESTVLVTKFGCEILFE